MKLIPLALLAAALLLASCSSDADPVEPLAGRPQPTATATGGAEPSPAPPTTATPDPTADPTPVPTQEPSATPTEAAGAWDASVQRVIDAVLAQDVETLASLVRYREEPCVPGGTEFGQLACEEGQAAGDPIRFIWGPGCHGTDLREERIHEHLARWTEGVTGLHAVALLPPHFGEAQHEGAVYRVIFERTETYANGTSAEVAIAYLLNEAGEIVMIADYCLAQPADLLLDQSQQPPVPLDVLEPPAGA